MSIDDGIAIEPKSIEERFVDLKRAEEDIEFLRAQKQLEIDTIITHEIREKLTALGDKYESKFAEANIFVDYIKDEIKKRVLESKVSVRGAAYQAVYVKGRTTWDSKALSGYALAHPEIEKLRKKGKPSVSIRRNKE